MYNRVNAKEQAKSILHESGGSAVGAGLLTAVLQIFPFVNAPALLGLNRYLLVSVDGNRPKASKVFSGFDNSLRAIGLYFWQLLWLIIWCAIPWVVYMIAVSITAGNIITPFALTAIFPGGWLGSGSMSQIIGLVKLMTVLTPAAYIASVVIYIWKATQYAFCFFVLADMPETPVLDCLNASKELTKGHIWDLVVLRLSFIGWYILSGFTLGILSILWVTPYYNLAWAESFRQIAGKPQSSSETSPREGETPSVVRTEAGLLGINGMYAGQKFSMNSGESFTIGRDASMSQIVISENSKMISRTHCHIRFDDQRNSYVVTDVSKNGVFLGNGSRIPAQQPNYLARGSVISLGDNSNSFRLL